MAIALAGASEHQGADGTGAPIGMRTSGRMQHTAAGKADAAATAAHACQIPYAILP